MPDQDYEGPGDGPGERFGDEARALLALVQHWAQRTMPAPPSGHPGPECQWCPLCQFASILRGESPDLAERVAEAGSAVVGALRALLENASGSGASPDSRVQHIRLDDEPPARTDAEPGAASRIQRIHLDDPEPDSAPGAESR